VVSLGQVAGGYECESEAQVQCDNKWYEVKEDAMQGYWWYAGSEQGTEDPSERSFV